MVLVSRLGYCKLICYCMHPTLYTNAALYWRHKCQKRSENLLTCFIKTFFHIFRAVKTGTNEQPSFVRAVQWKNDSESCFVRESRRSTDQQADRWEQRRATWCARESTNAIFLVRYAGPKHRPKQNPPQTKIFRRLTFFSIFLSKEDFTMVHHAGTV